MVKGHGLWTKWLRLSFAVCSYADACDVDWYVDVDGGDNGAAASADAAAAMMMMMMMMTTMPMTRSRRREEDGDDDISILSVLFIAICFSALSMKLVGAQAGSLGALSWGLMAKLSLDFCFGVYVYMFGAFLTLPKTQACLTAP